jgi:hypothetical protein
MTKGPQCSICRHPARAELETGMVRGVAVPALARRFACSEDALRRHKANHITQTQKAAILAGPELEGVDLSKLREVEERSSLANLHAIRHRLWAALDYAEQHGDVNQIARVTAQLHKNAELGQLMVGGLHTGTTNITNNILISAEYINLRMSLVKVLQGFPEAARAVAEVLNVIEAKAADEIAAEANRGLER